MHLVAARVPSCADYPVMCDGLRYCYSRAYPVEGGKWADSGTSRHVELNVTGLRGGSAKGRAGTAVGVMHISGLERRALD